MAQAGQPLQGPRGLGLGVAGTRRPTGAVAQLRTLARGGGSPGPVLTSGIQLCAGAQGHARVEGLPTVWLSVPAPLWVRGDVTVVIILPRKDAGIRAWRGSADHPRRTQTLEPPKARAAQPQAPLGLPSLPHRGVAIPSVATGGMSGSRCGLAAGAAGLRRLPGKASESTPAPSGPEPSALSLCVQGRTSEFLSEGRTWRDSLGRGSCPVG